MEIIKNEIEPTNKREFLRLAIPVIIFWVWVGMLTTELLVTENFWNNFKYKSDIDRVIDEVDLTTLGALINSQLGLTGSSGNRSVEISDNLEFRYGDIIPAIDKLEGMLNSMKNNQIFEYTSEEGVLIEVSLNSLFEFRLFMEKVKESEFLSELDVLTFYKLRQDGLMNLNNLSFNLDEYLNVDAENIDSLSLARLTLQRVLNLILILGLFPIHKIVKKPNGEFEAILQIPSSAYVENYTTTIYEP